jgi:hypothetical protein
MASYMHKLETVDQRIERLRGRVQRRFTKRDEEARLRSRSKIPISQLMTEEEIERLNDATIRESKVRRVCRLI